MLASSNGHVEIVKMIEQTNRKLNTHRDILERNQQPPRIPTLAQLAAEELTPEQRKVITRHSLQVYPDGKILGGGKRKRKTNKRKTNKRKTRRHRKKL